MDDRTAVDASPLKESVIKESIIKESIIFVVAGEVCVAPAPARLVTVLGSCVSVCLWSMEMRLGGMNHFLFPSSSSDRSARRGDVATDQLIARILAAGAPRAGLVAKVFGGASSGLFQWHVGPDNVISAWEAVTRARIPIVATDVAGQQGRHLTFDTATGIVNVRYLASPPALTG